MAYKTAVAVPRSGNQWIDGLVDGLRWGVTPEDTTVGYTFISDTSLRISGEFGGYPSWGWSAEEREVMEHAIDSIEAVCRLTFLDRGNDNSDNVELWFYSLDDNNAEGTYGFAYTPGSDIDEGLVAVNWSLYRLENGSFEHSIEPGSFHGITFLHELSHAVGLKHPHDRGLLGYPRFPGLTRTSNEFKDKGEFDQNAHPYTQLSYVDKGARNGLVPTSKADSGFLQQPGALDIAALQWIYGINPTTASGDNVYRLPLKNQEGSGWRAIWDTGGNDRITASRATSTVTIDLRNATLGTDVQAGGFVSRVDGITGGFTIAHDWDGLTLDLPAGLCVIEEAIGGKGDDRLIGNSASNRLKGKKGADVLYAGTGSANLVVGGKGRDQLLINATAGAYVTVKDFNRRKDRLVFDVPSTAVAFQARAHNTEVFSNGEIIATLLGEQNFNPDRHALFIGFDAFDL